MSGSTANLIMPDAPPAFAPSEKLLTVFTMKRTIEISEKTVESESPVDFLFFAIILPRMSLIKTY